MRAPTITGMVAVMMDEASRHCPYIDFNPLKIRSHIRNLSFQLQKLNQNQTSFYPGARHNIRHFGRRRDSIIALLHMFIPRRRCNRDVPPGDEPNPNPMTNENPYKGHKRTSASGDESSGWIAPPPSLVGQLNNGSVTQGQSVNRQALKLNSKETKPKHQRLHSN